MNESTTYIDDYFNGLLNPEEKRDFETRCEVDEAFAAEVAGYIASRSAIRDELLQQKRKEWEGHSIKKNNARIVNLKRWYMVAAAAAVICMVVLFVPFSKSPQQMAGNYIDDNLQQISVTMSGTTDSLQNGISAYNKKAYAEAHEIFSRLYLADPNNSEALKYDGLCSLMQEDYTGALRLFDALAAKQNLFSNPGLFYKALVLLKRNGAGDEDAARKLLKQVVEKELEGHKEAAGLLQKM